MKKYLVAGILILFTLALLVGCTPAEKTVVVNEGEEEEALLAVPTVTITGNGKLSITPDKATFSVGVETSAKTSKEASEQNAEMMEQIAAVLDEFHVEKEDRTTENYFLYETIIYDDNGDRKGKGYVASNSLSVNYYDMETLGDVIDAVTEAGATQLFGVYFSAKDPDSYNAELAKRAVEDAKKQAEAYAEALGMKLGSVVSVSDGYINNEEVIYRETLAADEAEMDMGENSTPKTSFEEGTLELSANVTIRYTLE